MRFTFRQPAATFFSAISQPYAAILSQSAVDAAGDTFGQHPIGTGPFVLSEWKAGQSLTLTPNPDYAWGPADVENKGTPHIDELVMRIIPDSAARDAALIAGEIDITYVDLPDEIRELDTHDDITITDLDTSAIYYLAFNMQKPPLDQLAVRQALSHLVNKDELVALAFDDIARTAYTLLPPDLPGNSPDLQQYELTYDPDRARQMLLDAGMTADADGMLQWQGAPLELALVTSARSVNTAMITVLESQFRTGGVALNIQQMEVAAATEAANAGEHDLFLWRYTWNDPDALHMWFGADRIGNGNRAFYSNAEVDGLFARGQTERWIRRNERRST